MDGQADTDGNTDGNYGAKKTAFNLKFMFTYDNTRRF